jgi:hypothetical protein
VVPATAPTKLCGSSSATLLTKALDMKHFLYTIYE